MKVGMAIATAALALFTCTAVACRQAPPSGSRPLTATSSDFAVRGEYRFVQMDRIDGLATRNGRVVLKGTPADLPVELAAAADLARPARRWALVTDAHVGGHRLITFTDSESVKDVSVELPDGDAPVHFAVFATTGAHGEVLVFATSGRDRATPSVFGHVEINPK
jgi:hypothetical protein